MINQTEEERFFLGLGKCALAAATAAAGRFFYAIVRVRTGLSAAEIGQNNYSVAKTRLSLLSSLTCSSPVEMR